MKYGGLGALVQVEIIKTENAAHEKQTFFLLQTPEYPIYHIFFTEQAHFLLAATSNCLVLARHVFRIGLLCWWEPQRKLYRVLTMHICPVFLLPRLF